MRRIGAWIAMFVESIVFNSLAMAIGGGVTMVGYSIVIQYIPPQPDYYMFITIGVGVVVGYFCSNIVKAAALKVIYIKGGVLVGSALSYLFWKERMSQGDLWLENLVSNGVGIEPHKWTTLVCIATMAVCAAGVFIQNTTARRTTGRRRTRRSPTRRTPRRGTAPRISERRNCIEMKRPARGVGAELRAKSERARGDSSAVSFRDVKVQYFSPFIFKPLGTPARAGLSHSHLRARARHAPPVAPPVAPPRSFCAASSRSAMRRRANLARLAAVLAALAQAARGAREPPTGLARGPPLERVAGRRGRLRAPRRGREPRGGRALARSLDDRVLGARSGARVGVGAGGPSQHSPCAPPLPTLCPPFFGPTPRTSFSALTTPRTDPARGSWAARRTSTRRTRGSARSTARSSATSTATGADT